MPLFVNASFQEGRTWQYLKLGCCSGRLNYLGVWTKDEPL